MAGLLASVACDDTVPRQQAKRPNESRQAMIRMPSFSCRYSNSAWWIGVNLVENDGDWRYPIRRHVQSYRTILGGASK